MTEPGNFEPEREPEVRLELVKGLDATGDDAGTSLAAAVSRPRGPNAVTTHHHGRNEQGASWCRRGL